MSLEIHPNRDLFYDDTFDDDLEIDGNEPASAPVSIIPPRYILNTASTTRDFLTRENNFLAALQFSINICIAGSAFVLQFQIGHTPRGGAYATMALSLGVLFYTVALLHIFYSVANYFHSIQRMRSRHIFITNIYSEYFLLFVCVVLFAAALQTFYRDNRL